jgi:hypothetical protein
MAYALEPVDRATAEAERRRLVDHMARIRPVSRGESESLYQQGFPIPPYQAGVDQVRAARDGSIWLRRGAFMKQQAEWLVLGETGATLATLRIPTDVEIHRVSRAYVWATSTGEWDEPYVIRFRVGPQTGWVLASWFHSEQLRWARRRIWIAAKWHDRAAPRYLGSMA